MNGYIRKYKKWKKTLNKNMNGLETNRKGFIAVQGETLEGLKEEKSKEDVLEGLKGINTYSEKISELYDTFKNEFDFNNADTVLVLKDILYQKYKMAKKKTK